MLEGGLSPNMALVQVGLSIGVDLVMVMLFIGYLVGVRRAQAA